MRRIHLQNDVGTHSSDPWQEHGFNGLVNMTQSRTIMIIDDSPTVRKIVEVSLQREGFITESYPDGIEALDAFVRNPQKRLPELVILDINLPKMNGYEVARYLRSKPRWNRTPIVMLTRHDGVIDRLKARLVGTQAYLTKPFKTQAIVDIVNSTLGLPAVPAVSERGQEETYASIL